MGLECNFSFKDLYNAALGKDMDPLEIQAFNSVSQEERNEKVKLWADMAGWTTEERIGSDGRVYVAFWQE